MSTPPLPVPMLNGGSARTPLRPGVGSESGSGCDRDCERAPWFLPGGDTNRPAPGMPVCAAGGVQRKTGADPGRRTRLPGGTTWIEILPTRLCELPRRATTTTSYVPGERVRPSKRPFRRTLFSPLWPRTDFLAATPQFGLGPCTTKTTLAGALRRKVTTVPRRFFGPRVEKRRRDARTLPLAREALLLPVADPDEPAPLCPVPSPDPWCPGAPGG